MKVLGIVCSPRLHGNTKILVQASLAKAQEEGADVELAHRNVFTQSFTSNIRLVVGIRLRAYTFSLNRVHRLHAKTEG